MRFATRGWRSARAYAAPPPVAAVPLPAPVVGSGAGRRLPPTTSAFAWPWQGVKWNLAFIGFCAYSVTVITYIAPIGQISMIVALAGLLIGRERVRFPAPLLFFAAYYLWAVLMYPSAEWPLVVKQNLLTVGRVVLIFLVAVNVLLERSRLRFYIFLYLTAFALYPVRGAIFNQFIYHAAELGRIAWNHMFSNPNDLAALLFVPMGLCAGVLYAERHKYVRWAAVAGIALMALIVFLTQSRGAILALACGIAWVVARQKRRLRMLPAILGMAGLIAMFAPDTVWTRLRNLGSATSSGELLKADDRGSAEQRFEIWRVAMRMYRDHPFTGVGLGAYPYHHWMYSRRADEGFKRTARGLRDAHSSYLTALTETGLPGFVFWMGIFISTYLFAQKARRAVRATEPDTERQIFFLQVSFIAMAVAAIFGSWNGIPFPYISAAILYAMAHLALERHRSAAAAARFAARNR